MLDKSQEAKNWNPFYRPWQISKSVPLFLQISKVWTDVWHFTCEKRRSISYLNNGILLPKMFWPTVRKNCSSDREKLLKFEAEGWEFAKLLRSLEQFIQTVKGQNNIW